MGYQIRQATRTELDKAVEWAAKEGWNPGLYDAQVFWDTDPEGFVVLEKEGEMIGSGSIVSYNGQFGFMDFLSSSQTIEVGVWEPNFGCGEEISC